MSLYKGIPLWQPGKHQWHDKIPFEHFQQLWPAIDCDFTKRSLKALNMELFMRGLGLINLIPKDGVTKILDDWHPITLLKLNYKVFTTLTLQLRLHSMLSNVISPQLNCSLATLALKSTSMVVMGTI